MSRTVNATDQLETLVMLAARAVRSAFNAGLEELGLTMTEAGALANLAAQGVLTQAELAQRLHIGRAATGSVVEALDRRGLVIRRADPLDRRVWQVELTPAGRSLADRFEERHAEIRAALHAGMPAADRKGLGRLLAMLASNAEAYTDQHG